jgi:deoxyadenosine/deoxycytidine kinase
MKIIALEALVGAGKTTLLTEIEKMQLPLIDILYEPLDSFTSFGLCNPLLSLYEDPLSNGGLFQCYAMDVLANNMRTYCINESVTYICDRTFDATQIFTNTMKSCKYISEFGYTYLSTKHQQMKSFLPPVNKVFFLDTDIDICLKRIQQRNRLGEENYNKDYLCQLKQHYDIYLHDFGQTNGADKVYRSSSLDLEILVKEMVDFVL